MRGNDQQQGEVFSYLSPESRVRKDHPLRAIRTMVDEVLRALSPEFDRMYARQGRPSIAPEKLLRAQMLQMLYSVRSDPRLETAMSLLIAHATAKRASGAQGRRSITVLDECWFLLDSPVLAPEVVQLFRTARKRNGSVWGISQTAEDFVGTESAPRVHGAGIVKNSSTKIIGQQPGDMTALREHLHLNETALNQIKHFSAPIKGKSADALIVVGEKAETTHTVRMSPTPVDYWISTTYARERLYRSWWLQKHQGKPLIEVYSDLAERFPFGLADCELLPEELSGQVAKGVAG